MRLGRLALAVPLALAACVGPPATKPKAAAPPPPIVVPPKPVADWRDLPENRGGWRYRQTQTGSEAAFGPPGQDLFTMRCDRAGRAVLLMRTGAATAALRITTSYGATSFPAGVQGGLVAVRLAASDPVLDRIAFSRGRFSVEGGGPILVIPAWAEPGRVIEDCRQP